MASSSIVHQANEDQAHPSMMAWRVHEFGPPNVMRFEQVPRADPGPGEVLVKVEAAGVGPWDGWIRAGRSVLPLPLCLVNPTGGWEIRFMVLRIPVHRGLCRVRLGLR
jgi:hypothetical protein